MTPTEWATLLIPFTGLLPGLYFLYLKATKDYQDSVKMLHNMTGDEYIETEAGAIAIDDEEWRVYFYRR